MLNEHHVIIMSKNRFLLVNGTKILLTMNDETIIIIMYKYTKNKKYETHFHL